MIPIKFQASDIELAKSFGLDISNEGLAKLNAEEQRQRATQFYNRVAAMSYQELAVADKTPKPVAPSAPPYIVSPDMVETGKRESFSIALEDAFWKVGGVHFLERMAKEQPLEFLKICSKLVAGELNIKGKGPLVNLVMSFYNEQEEKEVNNLGEQNEK